MYFTRKDNVRRDLDNIATSVLDALVLGKALPDDDINNIRELHIYDMGVSKDNVGVSVHLDGDEE
jgi:Holliday junction resolvase RusA-like endonuclease